MAPGAEFCGDADWIFQMKREIGVMGAQLVRQFVLEVSFVMEARAPFARRREHRLDLDHLPPPVRCGFASRPGQDWVTGATQATSPITYRCARGVAVLGPPGGGTEHRSRDNLVYIFPI